jgi:NAD-dependent SIR2 family protein deacetylase
MTPLRNRSSHCSRKLPSMQADAASAPAADLHAFVLRHPRLLVLTGAGVSTDSGIPDYRDADGQWTRGAPVLLQDFLAHEAVRRRYWARSMAGWPAVARARPNAAHEVLAELQARGYLEALVTQNVDGLHQRAGSRAVIELHGNLARVRCRDCGAVHSRRDIQRELENDHPALAGAIALPAPDGDAHLEACDLAQFRVPACRSCGGMLKPDVVFFGEGVPRPRVEAASEALARADALLVVGSSLMVYSGYRFCEWAAAMGKPMVAINLGRTRADRLLALKIEASCAPTLSGLAGRLKIGLRAAVEKMPEDEERVRPGYTPS